MRDLLAGLPEIGSVPEDNEQSTLVLHSMREAFFYARQCCRGKLQDDEIFSACYEALCEAARNFKPGGSVRFFGYAKQYIRGRSGLVKVWRSKDVVRNKKGERREGDFHSEVAFKPDEDRLDLGWNDDSDRLTEWIMASKKMDATPTSTPDINAIEVREEYELLKPMLKQLTDKEQSVIALRYRSEFTFEKIGSLLGTSPADSQVTHARALKKLRRLARQKLGTVN